MSEHVSLIEVWRGGIPESCHNGVVAVFDDEGRKVYGWGDTSRIVFPRSAIKAIQALPLVESGAADAYGFGDDELALACASHSGEPEHAQLAAAMLEKAGYNGDELECGAHWPTRTEAAYALAREGASPTALHNNCSGKHAGFLAYARKKGYAAAGYVGADHPVQRDVRAAIESMLGVAVASEACGIDGCSIPTFAVPIDRLATAFARLGTGNALPPERARAAARLRKACAAAPHMVAGTGRFCTDVMRLFGERVFVKTGAEGVYVGILPELKLGFALKCDDGATRAAELMAATLLRTFLPMSDAETQALTRITAPVLKNWRGIEVGKLTPSAAFLSSLHSRDS